MLNELHAPSSAPPADQSSTRRLESEGKIVYWHRELPPLEAEPLGEHTVEADSMRVTGDIAHGDDLWEECYRDLMAQAHLRLAQEIHRLGGDYAHVLDETIGAKHDYSTNEVWLHGRFRYLLLQSQRTVALPTLT